MARTPVPVSAITRAGLTAPAETAADTVNGNSVANTNQNVILVVRNADGAAPHNLTLHLAARVDGQAPADRVVAIAATVTKYFGPFSRAEYGSVMTLDGADANLKITALLVSV